MQSNKKVGGYRLKKQDIYYLPFVKAIPDKMFLKLHYRISCGKRLDLKNPKNFNEKIQWSKLYCRNPLYTTMVDKYEVKKYVSSIIGEKYIIPTLGVWSNFDEIKFDDLPEQFVLKTTHDSGGVLICRDKSAFDFREAEKFFSKRLKRNYYYNSREWAYKDVKPRIIAEQLIVSQDDGDLKDYKVFCFNGIPKTIQVDIDRFHTHTRNLYTVDWKYIEGSLLYPTNPSVTIEIPKVLQEMLELSRKLSEIIPLVRVDFYLNNDKLYFGELTLYHGGGFEKFTPNEINEQWGEWIDLSKQS